MIISASRRTDIPAFYAEWFMNRLEAGYCLVPNPLNPKQVARIAPLEKQRYVFDKDPRKNLETGKLLARMSDSAAEHGMEIFACAD